MTVHPSGLPDCILEGGDEVAGGPFVVTPGVLQAFVARIEAGYASADAELEAAVSPIPGVTGETKPEALEGTANAL